MTCFSEILNNFVTYNNRYMKCKDECKQTNFTLGVYKINNNLKYD